MKHIVRYIIPAGILGISLVLSLFIGATSVVHADATSTSTLQAQITQSSSQISSIEKDIAAYQAQLNTLSGQKNTLQTSISSINVSQKKTQAQIQLTQAQIDQATANIQTLQGEIATKESSIDLDKQTLAASLREIDSDDKTPFLAQVFSAQSFEDLWSTVASNMQFAEALKEHTDSLNSDAVALNGQQTQVSSTKDQLTDEDTTLQTQNEQLVVTKQSKQQLLAQTDSKESTYQTLLATKKAEETQFEQQLQNAQNQLKNISPSEVPHTGQGILAWPFSDSVMQNCVGKESALGNQYCITQYFGNTPFATANAAIYSGMGHDGVDIGVPIGTPVHAALDGVVADTGDTDLVKGCYSFGKWVMLKHSNGLNTMYAHLSQISVTPGQAVTQGQLLGYSGMTGYATGPHLHFGVYATAGVKFLTLNQFRGDTTTGCANAEMPVAPEDAYLNPLSYLPV
jgi:murein DD-endopeptidase MepM/ murein hydrolase activator NlpD